MVQKLEIVRNMRREAGAHQLLRGRGRALAGLAGDTSARIFCLSLEAEMVSISGLYRVNEDIPPASFKKPAQIYLKDGYLTIDPFSDRFSGNS